MSEAPTNRSVIEKESPCADFLTWQRDFGGFYSAGDLSDWKSEFGIAHAKGNPRMTRQCLHGRRIGELSLLQEEIGAWSLDVTSTQRGVDWQMKIDDARSKLKSVYPKILV